MRDTQLVIYWDTQDLESIGWGYRITVDGEDRETGGIDDLADLRDVLRTAVGYGWTGYDGTPTGCGLDAYPTFGGTSPADTIGIASWDCDSVLWIDGWTILPRDSSAESMVLCQSADGWSFHAPGSTDEEIARGDAPPVLDGPGEPADEDRELAFRRWREQA